MLSFSSIREASFQDGSIRPRAIAPLRFARSDLYLMDFKTSIWRELKRPSWSHCDQIDLSILISDWLKCFGSIFSLHISKNTSSSGFNFCFIKFISFILAWLRTHSRRSEMSGIGRVNVGMQTERTSELLLNLKPVFTCINELGQVCSVASGEIPEQSN
jgi:hypothetical protein